MPTKRIAIVEDDMNIRDIVESYLLKEGYETIGVDSAGIHSPLTTPDA
jgi:DNA-binding response OmpR family regulator